MTSSVSLHLSVAEREVEWLSCNMSRHSSTLTWLHDDRRARIRFNATILAVVFFAASLPSYVASQRPCALSRVSKEPPSSGTEKGSATVGQVYVKVNCSSRGIVQIPKDVHTDVTNLDLSGNYISFVGEDDFLNMLDLHDLDLSSNSMRALEGRCFRQLRHLERLDLSNNNITSFTSDVFSGLESLRVLVISRLPLTSYPTEFVAHTRELRVLSISAMSDATIPAEYASLPRLDMLDFYKDTVNLTKIISTMFHRIRGSTITTLSFRNMYRLLEVEAGAFSNLPNARSLIMSCNKHLSFMKTVAALGLTTNTSVDTVVLDGATGDGQAKLVESDFCTPFWRRVHRLSVRCVRLSSFHFSHESCLANMRQFIGEYNSIDYVTPNIPFMPAIFPNLQTLSFSHRTLRTSSYRAAYCRSRHRSLFHVDAYFPTKPQVLSTGLANNIGEKQQPCPERLPSRPSFTIAGVCLPDRHAHRFVFPER
ncbi:hypothetical protein LSAT2_008437 [Lamellibrachia satsuma]|nr:hypothetical protein LSAT2_008437 [Lamellibrachia satsuma]